MKVIDGNRTTIFKCHQSLKYMGHGHTHVGWVGFVTKHIDQLHKDRVERHDICAGGSDFCQRSRLS